MAHAIYLADVIGTGTQADPYRPDVPAGTAYSCVMIHEAKRKCIVLTADDALPNKTGRSRLFNGLNLADLRGRADTTNPTGAQRTAINTWLTNNGFQAVPGDMVTWREVVEFAAGQVNPGVRLATVGV